MGKFKFKELLKGITEVKEGKVHGPYISVEQVFSEMDNKRKQFKLKNPIGYFLYYEVWLRLYRLWSNDIQPLPREIKHFFQRAVNSYDDSSWWQYNYHLAKISIPMLKSLKEHCHVVHTEFLPKDHVYYKDHTISKEDEDFCIAEWNRVLDKIITTFEYVLKLENGDWKAYYVPSAAMRKWWAEHTEKFGVRMMTKEEKQAMDEGLKLWSKWFMYLND